ncbi:sigma-54-dependent Fis family transcriptional regulator [Alteribacillus sp. YIM 98480]|uniref:sigma-54-dependent Fis family transcriptional regulator n=1 Tax=Alteribacillus sp. YIM 98480 TaxID=2606599 RepID=UPI001E62D8F4|nr:sigma-54-dependent Fis family transcriptional regulator [Alteribacillus sp. YIM 98480]
MTPVEKSLYPNTTLYEAIAFMKDSKWDTIPVVDHNEKIIGVFTRSTLYQMLLNKIKFNTEIGPFIKQDIGTLNENMGFEEVQQSIENSEVGTGVVINENGEPTGLLTKTNAVIALLNRSYYLQGQLETILSTSHIGALMTDENNHVVFVNQMLKDMMGLPEDQLLNNKLPTLLPQVREMEQESHQRVKIGDYHLMMRLTKYHIKDGKKGAIALFQNISELENMSQELESVKKWKSTLQTVIENAYDGLVMVNETGRITFISPSLLELFDLKNQEVNNTPIELSLPHLELPKTLKTGVADISDFKEIKGINYIVHRIPLYQEDQIIGAIGKVVFRQLQEVHQRLRGFEDSEKERPNDHNEKAETSQYTFDHIITNDSQMKKLMRAGMKAGKGRSTILIRGESGTGKELFAHGLHQVSARADGPFITVNCAAIPEHLLESEFFGYEEGAFTGAVQKGKLGKFDLAHKGTLFLDEIGDMSFLMQAKLLRVLQENGFYRVGGTKRVQVDVRIITATHRSLEEMVQKGEFREDLFYRLNVISLEIPPLRKRKEDIYLLSQYIIPQLNKVNGTSITGIDPLAQEIMIEYHWPGNVRELRNILERAMIFAEHGMIQVEDLPNYVLNQVGRDRTSINKDNDQYSLLEQAEKTAIHQALHQAKGNKSKAAKLLGVSRSVLYDKLKKYDHVL